MNNVARIALYAAPFVAVGAGIVGSQLLAREACEAPTMRVAQNGGAFRVTPEVKQAALRCGDAMCFVDGPERVALVRDGGTECLDVEADGSIGFRAAGANMSNEERPQ